MYSHKNFRKRNEREKKRRENGGKEINEIRDIGKKSVIKSRVKQRLDRNMQKERREIGERNRENKIVRKTRECESGKILYKNIGEQQYCS